MKISNLVRNKDARTLAGNFVWLSALQVASYLFPLITMPYLARVIGVEGFGKIAFATAVMVWIQTLADWGFNYTATRDIAQNREDKKRVSEIFSNVLWARCFLMFVSFGCLLLLIVLVPKFKMESNILLITFLMIPGHILFPDWFFQAIEKMKYITILNVLMKLFFTVTVFVVIKDPSDYIFQPLLVSLGFILSGVIAMFIIVVKWKVEIFAPRFSSVWMALKGSANVFVNTIVPNLYNSFSIVLLGFFSGGTANGYFDGGNKFIQVGDSLMQVLSRAFFPFLSRRIEHHHIYSRLSICCAFVMSMLLFLLAPFLIDILLTSQFKESVIVMRILAVSIIFLTISNVYGTNYLLVNHHEKEMRNVTLISSLIGFAVAWPLVYCYSYIGAALTITISRVILGVLMWWRARQLKQSLCQRN